jgi:hypothetical protein
MELIGNSMDNNPSIILMMIAIHLLHPCIPGCKIYNFTILYDFLVKCYIKRYILLLTCRKNILLPYFGPKTSYQ